MKKVFSQIRPVIFSPGRERFLSGKVLKTLTPLAIYALLAFFILLPASADPIGKIIGNFDNDIWFHLWGFWWTKIAVFSQAHDFLFSSLLNYPEGASLFVIDAVGGAISSVIQLVAPLSLSFNITIFLFFTGAGFGAYLLCRHITRSFYGSLLGGLVFMTLPVFLNQAESSITETLNTAWIPLFMLQYIKNLKAPTAARTISSVIFLVLASLGTWYYGAGCVLFAVMYYFHSLLLADKCRVTVRRTLLALMILASSALLLLPVKSSIESTMNSKNAFFTRSTAKNEESLFSQLVVDARLYFLPFKKAPYKGNIGANKILVVVYLGYATLFLAALALLSGRRIKPRFWLFNAGLFTLLSAGFYLYFNGSFPGFFGYRPALPYLALFKNSGIFSKMAHTTRFVVFAGLFLSILSASGTVFLQKAAKSSKTARALLLSLPAVILAENLFIAPITFPLSYVSADIPAVYKTIKEDRLVTAVLDLPMSDIYMGDRIYFYYQTLHMKKLPILKIPRFLEENQIFHIFNYSENPALKDPAGVRVAKGRISIRADSIPRSDIEASLNNLKKNGIGYVIWHFDLYRKFKGIEKGTLIKLLHTFGIRPVVDGNLAYIKL